MLQLNWIGQVCLGWLCAGVSQMRSHIQVKHFFVQFQQTYEPFTSPPRSRQQWYGNPEPEHQGVVATEIAHVWPGVGLR